MSVKSIVALCAFVLLGALAVPVTTATAADPTGVLRTEPLEYNVGDSITVDANFDNGSFKITLWTDVTGTWAPVDDADFVNRSSTKYGNKAFTGFVADKPQNLQARTSHGQESNVLALDPKPLPGVGDPEAPTSGVLTVTPTEIAAGDPVNVDANFPSGSFKITLFTDVTGTWAPVANSAFVNRSSTSSGNKNFGAYTATKGQKLQARTSTGQLTNIVTVTEVPSTATLDPITGSGKSVTATFAPVRSGKTTELQVETIKTSETDEMPAKKWVTIATGKQSSAGKVTYSISDPLEVEHSYRAVSGATTSNVVKFAAPMPEKATGLSQVYFNTYEGDSVNTRTRYFEGEFSMTASSSLPQCKEIAPIKKSTMKGRGNYSWSFDKKSFTLKIDKSKNLCGLGGSKKWALVANHYDKSLLRNTVAYHLSSKFTNLAWSPKSAPVDLYVNGSYRGSYVLIERRGLQNPQTEAEEPDIDKRNTARIDVPELKDEGQETDPDHPNNQHPNITGGYILEWDFRKGGYKNITVGKRGYAAINDPEDGDPGKNEGISKQQVNYINDYVDKADAALFSSDFKDSGTDGDGKGWREYIDADSAVDYYILMEFMKPVDGNMWASVNMYKQRDGYKGQSGKLYFGPAWDFDLAAGSATRAGNVASTSGWYLRDPLNISAKQSSETWFNRLNDDSGFQNAVKQRWNELYPTLSSTSFIEQQEALIKKSADENWKKWSRSEKLSSYQTVKGSWGADVDHLKSWMSSRRSWLNGQY